MNDIQEATEQGKSDQERFVMFSFGLMYLITVSLFLWILIARHIPNVGMEYVISHWPSYLIGIIAGHSVFALFYCFAMLTTILLKT